MTGSPFGQFGQDLFHGRVLLSHIVDDALNDCVLLAFLLKVGAGLLLGHLRLEAVWFTNKHISYSKFKYLFSKLTSGDLAVVLTHDFKLPICVGDLSSLKLRIEQVNLPLTELLAILLISFFLSVDVVADIVDLSLSLCNSCVKLHGLLSRMFQVLLEVGNLAG